MPKEDWLHQNAISGGHISRNAYNFLVFIHAWRTVGIVCNHQLYEIYHIHGMLLVNRPNTFLGYTLH